MEERILEIADRLFYRQGIRAVGVDTIADEVGISKRTLYNHFPDLSRRLARFKAYDGPPLEQILGDFERLEREFTSSEFRGCAFVNAVAELGEPKHAANKIAVAFKEQRRLWFRDLLTQLDVAHPDELASQLMLLIDGAISAALVRGGPEDGPRGGRRGADPAVVRGRGCLSLFQKRGTAPFRAASRPSTRRRQEPGMRRPAPARSSRGELQRSRLPVPSPVSRNCRGRSRASRAAAQCLGQTT